ncbi:MAG: polysaccharide biosynthesis tyrosine autokinase [Desulfohalobiaceae bacterium]|nr:polysaccharide biosynthesis tyrosine autokinase [Desulfohalobiaceae bacterium]
MGKIYEALMKAEEESGQPGTEQAMPLAPSYGFDPQGELVVLGKPGSVIAEQFRFLRSQLIRPQEGCSPRTIQVTSSLPGEGKTFAASNLAVTVSQGLDEYVLLVDMDLRNSRMGKVFGFKEDTPGLSEHLAENIPLEKLLQKTSLKKLTLVTAGTKIEKPAELLSSYRMKEFIQEIRNRYPDRYVIIDSPPIEMAPESLAIANEVDGVFLLVLRAKTPRDRVATSLERIKKEKILGLIFNGDQKSHHNYRNKSAKLSGYGYGYCYK